VKTRRASAGLLAALCVTLTLVTRGGSAEPSVVPSRILQAAAAEGSVRVIVHLGGLGAVPEAALSSASAVASQRQQIASAQDTVRQSLRGTSHRILRQYQTIPYLAIDASPDTLRMVESLRGVVTAVHEDFVLRSALGQSAAVVQAPPAWEAGRDGSGTVIAILDTGVDKNHEFLAGKVVEEACFAAGGSCPNGQDTQLGPGSGVPCTFNPSGCSHGTHVAGIAAGLGGPPTSASFSGIGRAAQIMSVQVFRDAGGGSPSAAGSDVLAGLERVYALRTTHDFGAVNMSLGGGIFTSTCNGAPGVEPFKIVIDNLRAAGIATVVASGNDGSRDAISFPACISTAVSVGSTDDGSFGTTVDRVSDYSNIAPFVSLLAPGKWITSSFPRSNPPLYQTISGTSMSTPHVAGAFAILKQIMPAVDVTTKLKALRSTGVPVTDTRLGAPGTTTLKRIRVNAAAELLETLDLRVTLLTGPIRVAAGASYTLEYAVRSTGGRPADASLVGLFLSPDTTITTDDVALGSVEVASLAPRTTATGSAVVQIPTNTSPGTYFFGAIANVDGAVDENDVSNNTRVSAAVQVVRPDYVVKSVTTSVGAAAPGSSFRVTQVIRNIAPPPNKAPASIAELFLSDDDLLDGGDVSLGTVAVPQIVAGGATTVVRRVQTPPGTPAGLYWVFARANAGDIVVEADLGNNVGATSKPLIVGPDLAPKAATPTPRKRAPGMTVSVATTVKNRGGQPAGAFDLTVYLSTNATFDAGVDVPVGTRRVSSLAAGATFTGSIVATLPADQPAGDYFLLVRADAGGEVAEADETNNVLATVVKVVPPDLATIKLTATPSVIEAGMTVSVKQAVKNLAGLAGKAAATTSRLYLSMDVDLDDGADEILLDVPIPALAGGATVSLTRSVQIPPETPAGTYYVIAAANVVSPIQENDPTGGANNILALATPITVSAATP